MERSKIEAKLADVLVDELGVEVAVLNADGGACGDAFGAR